MEYQVSVTRIGEVQAKEGLTEALREFLILHKASVKNIPPEKLAEIRPLLASAPSGGYHNLIHEK